MFCSNLRIANHWQSLCWLLVTLNKQVGSAIGRMSTEVHVNRHPRFRRNYIFDTLMYVYLILFDKNLKHFNFVAGFQNLILPNNALSNICFMCYSFLYIEHFVDYKNELSETCCWCRPNSNRSQQSILFGNMNCFETLFETCFTVRITNRI